MVESIDATCWKYIMIIPKRKQMSHLKLRFSFTTLVHSGELKLIALDQLESIN